MREHADVGFAQPGDELVRSAVAAVVAVAVHAVELIVGADLLPQTQCSLRVQYLIAVVR